MLPKILADADPGIVEFLEGWKQARQDGVLVPRKSDFDPLSIPRLLASTWLYVFDPDAGDFRCLLEGEEVNAAWGGLIKGLSLKQVVGAADHPIVLGRWRQILETPLAHFGKAGERLTEQSIRRAERLILPLADDDGVPAYTLGCSLYRLGPVDLGKAALGPEDIVQIPCELL